MPHSQAAENAISRQPAAQQLERALGLLGSIEAPVMRGVWSGTLRQPFTVRDALSVAPGLAYTTIMTVVVRLADKGLLSVRPGLGQRAHRYTSALSPAELLARSSQKDAQLLVDRYGDAALAAFALQLEQLTPEQRARLQGLAEE